MTADSAHWLLSRSGIKTSGNECCLLP